MNGWMCRFSWCLSPARFIKPIATHRPFCSLRSIVRVFTGFLLWSKKQRRTKKTSDLPHLNPAWTRSLKKETMQTPVWPNPWKQRHKDVIQTRANFNFCCSLYNHYLSSLDWFHWKYVFVFLIETKKDFLQASVQSSHAEWAQVELQYSSTVLSGSGSFCLYLGL